MTPRKKNILLIAVLVLLSCTAIIQWISGYSLKKSDWDESMFATDDTARVSKVVMEGKSLYNSLEKINGTWWVNKKYKMDPSMSKVLMAVLYDVRVRRKPPKKLLPEIIDKLIKNGIKVSIFHDQKLVRSFTAGGNGISLSYFMGDPEDPYIVQLPGYDSYVSGIFDVSENDWRDRLILSTSWAGLKKYSLSYTGDLKSGFIIKSNGKLPQIEGIDLPDTSKLMNYLDQFQYFAADHYIDNGKIPGYDSLSHTIPWAMITVDAVSIEKPVLIKFFKKGLHDPFILGLIDDNQLALFSYARIKEIFKNKSYFKRS
jgi:hypothetical protein